MPFPLRPTAHRAALRAARRAARWAALLPLVLPLAACQSGSTQPAAAAASLTVAVETPQWRTWPAQVTASGALKPWQEAVISAETGPLRITAINVDVGAQVHRGQVLATLSGVALAADQARLRAALDEAQANLAQAASDVSRADMVGSGGGLSDQQIQKYRITRQTSAASVAQARAQLRSTQIDLARTRVVAVDDGVVSSRSALLGKVATTGDELFRLVRQNRIEWQAELDAGQLARVAAGQHARVTLPDGAVLEGTVRLVAPTLSSDTSRGLAYVSLPVGSPARAGMYGSGQIETGQAHVLTLPDTAVVLRDGRAYVFVVGRDGRVAQQAVSAGQRRDGRVEITGLSPRAPVVQSGGAFLSDGVIVRVAAAGSAGKGTGQ